MKEGIGGAAAYFNSQALRYDRQSRRGLWAMVRKREAAAVLSLAGKLDGKSVLDLGCGAGFYSRQFQQGGACVFGVDSSPAMIAELVAGGHSGVCADLATLRLGRKFDFIAAAGVLEFLPGAELLFAAAREHAQPGARLLVLSPRLGPVGLAYKAWHELRGCATFLHSAAEVTLAAQAHGWREWQERGAGPLAVVRSFMVSSGTPHELLNSPKGIR